MYVHCSVTTETDTSSVWAALLILSCTLTMCCPVLQASHDNVRRQLLGDLCVCCPRSVHVCISALTKTTCPDKERTVCNIHHMLHKLPAWDIFHSWTKQKYSTCFFSFCICEMKRAKLTIIKQCVCRRCCDSLFSSFLRATEWKVE